MARGSGKKSGKGNPSKSQKKKRINRPMLQLPNGQMNIIDSSGVTPDFEAIPRHPRYTPPQTFDVCEFYIPMKVYPLNNFRELSQMCKESNYNDLQKENRFRNSQTDESVIDDLISDDPDKSNKVVMLAEAGNGKTTMARRILRLIQEKFPDKLAFFIDLKEIGKKKERSLPEMILPEEYQRNSKGDRKNANSAMKVIFTSPDDCVFIIDSLEEFEDNDKVIDALVNGESQSPVNLDQQEDPSSVFDQVLPTWQWINELLVGKRLNFGDKRARIIVMARPETIAYYRTPNPYYHRRPGMGWNQLSEEHFDESGFSISCIFGISVADLRDNFPTAVMHRDDLHRSFIDFILEQPSFAYFCRKPFQMHLLYDTFHEVAGTDLLNPSQY